MTGPDDTVWICKSCRKDFFTETQLRDHSGVHMGRHEKGVYYCPENTEDGKPCKFRTDRVEKLNVHLTEIHHS